MLYWLSGFLKNISARSTIFLSIFGGSGFFGEVPCALLVFWIYLGIFRRGLLIFEYFAGSTSILNFLQGFMCSAS